MRAFHLMKYYVSYDESRSISHRPDFFIDLARDLEGEDGCRNDMRTPASQTGTEILSESADNKGQSAPARAS